MSRSSARAAAHAAQVDRAITSHQARERAERARTTARPTRVESQRADRRG